jgi:acetylglutamate kinase
LKTSSGEILAEALPHIRGLFGKVVVVKYGGNAIARSSHEGPYDAFAQDIVALTALGARPVVVHGGGPQIGEMMERLGKTSRFIRGQRVTDMEALNIVRMVLVGTISCEITASICRSGGTAVGISGQDANLILAEITDPSLGRVGDVVKVDGELLGRMISPGIVPVIASIGADAAGEALNINADAVAGFVAASVKADMLIVLSDVNGLRSDVTDAGSVLQVLSAQEIDNLIDSGVISGGMIPKMLACQTAVRGGVREARIIDGTIPRATLLSAFSDAGQFGTTVIQDSV